MGRLADETTVSSRNQTGETRGRGRRTPASAEILAINGEARGRLESGSQGGRELEVIRSFIHSFKDHCRSYSV